MNHCSFLQLCNSADSARRKIDALKKEKDEVQTAIAEFQGSSKSRSVGNRDLYRDVDKYDQLLTETTRKHQEAKEKSTRVRLLLEESRMTVGRFLKTLSSFGDSSMKSSDEPSMFVPSISSLPKALQNVKSQVSVMLEQLSQLLIMEEEQGQSDSRLGSSTPGGSEVFLTQIPTSTAGGKMVQKEEKAAKEERAAAAAAAAKEERSAMSKESERAEDSEAEKNSETGSDDGKESEKESEKESGSRSSSLTNDTAAAAAAAAAQQKRPSMSSSKISRVLDNPKADRLIFESLMSAAPDLSNQNLRVDRERNKVLTSDSAVAHLLGIELPVLEEDDSHGDVDVSGIPHDEDPGIKRAPRGWDAMLPKHDTTAVLERTKIKHLSNHLVDRQRKREMKETAEMERRMKEQEAREKRRFQQATDQDDYSY